VRRIKTRRIKWGPLRGTTEPMLEMPVSEYRLLLAVARAAEQMNKTYGYGLCERELVAALDKLNARKERKP
jgi:hypothetical protein